MFTLPNLFTLARLVLAPFVASDILHGRDGRAIILLFAAGFTDVIDGFLARRFKGGIRQPLRTAPAFSAGPVCEWRVFRPWFCSRAEHPQAPEVQCLTTVRSLLIPLLVAKGRLKIQLRIRFFRALRHWRL